MTPARELLLSAGIKLRNYNVGEHTAICPRCSAHRNKKRVECLDVRITADDRAFWNCHHCAWSGPEKGSAPRAAAGPADRLTTYVYNDPDGQPVRRKVRNAPGREPKMWWQHWNGAEWVKAGEFEIAKERKDFLYRIDEVAREIARGAEIAIVEGEKDADRMWSIDIAATCSPNGAAKSDQKAKWFPAYARQLKGAKVVIFNDNDAAGLAHAKATTESCLRVCAQVKRVVMSELWPQAGDGDDVSDFLDSDGSPTQIHAAIGAALPLGKATNNGAAAAPAATAKPMQGHEISIAEFVPADEAVTVAELLEEITDELRRYMILPAGALEKVALWILHTWVFRAARWSPRIGITAAAAACGKSTLLDFIGVLSCRPYSSGCLTPASYKRVVTAKKPTMMMDEFDAWANKPDSELPAILNNGAHYKGKATLCVGKDWEVREFPVYAPCAYAHIGDLPGIYNATRTRTIPVKLQRRSRREAIERVPDDDYFNPLNRKLARFSQDYFAAVKTMVPRIESGTRSRDIWVVLLAIAALAGDDWSHRAIEAIDPPAAAVARNEQALEDMRLLFVKTGQPFITSRYAVEQLIQMEDRPWPDLSKGKALTTISLARLLKNFSIRPSVDGKYNERGYHLKDFAEAFDRYLEPLPGVAEKEVSGSDSVRNYDSPFSLRPVESLANPQPNGFAHKKASDSSRSPARASDSTLEDDLRDFFDE